MFYKIIYVPIISILGTYETINHPVNLDDRKNVSCKDNLGNSITDSSKLDFLSSKSNQTSLLPVHPLLLPPCLSTSLEDIRKRNEEGSNVRKEKGRRRRTTLPKRRFSDLHLHLLLCPTRSSCSNGSSSDDMPLTTTSQRAHRSLPDSPSELDEVSSFCFDFLDKNSKDKVCILYI